MHIGLGSSNNGILSTQLPLGAAYDSYYLRIYVQIIDNDNGITYYTIPIQLQVTADLESAQSIFNQIENLDSSSSFIAKLFNGRSQDNIQAILTLSSILNSMSSSDKVGISISGTNYAKLILKKLTLILIQK